MYNTLDTFIIDAANVKLFQKRLSQTLKVTSDSDEEEEEEEEVATP